MPVAFSKAVDHRPAPLLLHRAVQHQLALPRAAGSALTSSGQQATGVVINNLVIVRLLQVSVEQGNADHAGQGVAQGAVGGQDRVAVGQAVAGEESR